MDRLTMWVFLSPSSLDVDESLYSSESGSRGEVFPTGWLSSVGSLRTRWGCFPCPLSLILLHVLSWPSYTFDLTVTLLFSFLDMRFGFVQRITNFIFLIYLGLQRITLILQVLCFFLTSGMGFCPFDIRFTLFCQLVTVRTLLILQPTRTTHKISGRYFHYIFISYLIELCFFFDLLESFLYL